MDPADLEKHLALYEPAVELNAAGKRKMAKRIQQDLVREDLSLTEDEGLLLCEMFESYKRNHPDDWEVRNFLDQITGHAAGFRIQGRENQALVSRVIDEFMGSNAETKDEGGQDAYRELASNQRYKIEEVLNIEKSELLLLAGQLKNWQEGYSVLRLKQTNQEKCFIDFSKERVILLFQGSTVVVLKNDYHKFMDSLDHNSAAYLVAKHLSADMSAGGPFVTMFKGIGYKEGHELYRKLLEKNHNDHQLVDQSLSQLVQRAFPPKTADRQ